MPDGLNLRRGRAGSVAAIAKDLIRNNKRLKVTGSDPQFKASV